jgi:hypothetical protein
MLPTPVCCIQPRALRVVVPRERLGVPAPKPPLKWPRLRQLASFRAQPEATPVPAQPDTEPKPTSTLGRRGWEDHCRRPNRAELGEFLWYQSGDHVEQIDHQATWRRVLTVMPIGLITIANGGSTVRLLYGILFAEPFTQQTRTLLSRRCDLADERDRFRTVVLGAGYHRWPGEVLQQSACDDPGMDKITVCVGLLSPYHQKASPRGLREATATGKNRSR